MIHIYLIGCKGIPARYGGFETFAEELTARKKSDQIFYHVACMNEAPDRTHNGADCFPVKVPNVGAARAILYDRSAFLHALEEIREKRYQAVIFVMACRLGPFFPGLVRKAHKLGVFVCVNPDGHEWLRSKWKPYVRKYWKYSEKKMVRHADLLACDSKEMERYIRTEYAGFDPKTVYLTYGAKSREDEDREADLRYEAWLHEKGLSKGEYALIVGRFVPENNYAVMLSEYMDSETDYPLCIITDHEGKPFYEELKERIGFDRDRRIFFAGTVYDTPLLSRIRRNAFCYLHGHEVGGTNPSLLEALAETEVNLLLDVPFNREVGEDAALYFTKERGSLSSLINRCRELGEEERRSFGEAAKKRIRENYSWERITAQYEAFWEKCL